MTTPTPPTLQEYVLTQLDRIKGEADWPSIQASLINQTRDVVAAWPDVLYMGLPMVLP